MLLYLMKTPTKTVTSNYLKLYLILHYLTNQSIELNII